MSEQVSEAQLRVEKLNAINEGRLEILERRATYLEQQLAFGKSNPVARRWMSLEADSLRWAVAYIRAASGNGDQSDEK